jgi:hypothetical protein
MKTSHWYLRSLLETSSSTEHCRHKSGKQTIRECMHDDVYIPGQIWDSFLSRWVLHTHIPKDYISTKMTLDNYNSFTDLKEHIQNLYSILKLVIYDSNVICKIFLTTFKGSIRVWYNNLKSSSITNFGDLYTKLVTQFSISIPAKKSFTKLFRVTW